MGYALNELANLPVDDNIHLYIFVVNGQYREPLYDIIQENFMSIAKGIGSNAAIAVGTDPKAFTSQVAHKYFGESLSKLFDALPALLITNAHPDKLTAHSVRLIVPLRGATERFGDWGQFFNSLAAYARGESDDFIKRFEKKEDLLDAANKVVSIRPGMFGISVNVNELYDRFKKRKKA